MKLCRSTLEFIVELYERLPSGFHRLGKPAIRSARILASLVLEIKLELLLCECTTVDRKNRFCLLYVGRIGQLEPALAIFNSRLIRQTSIGTVFCWQLKHLLEEGKNSEELTFLRVNSLLYSWLKPGGFVPILPNVKSVLSLADTKELTQATFSETTLRKFRKVAAKGYYWRIDRDSSSLQYFYDDIYRPYALARYGALAQLASFQKVRRLYRTGILLFVKRDDQVVAACICRKILDVLWFELVGFVIVQGDVLDQGAGDALYVALVELAFGLSCSHINFRDSRPFLNDGSLQYKVRWGGRIMDDRKAIGQLGVGLGSLKKGRYHPFLEHYPVFQDRGELSGLVLLDQGHAANLREIQAICNTYLRPGLARLYVWSFVGFEPEVRIGSPACSGRIHLVDLSAVEDIAALASAFSRQLTSG